MIQAINAIRLPYHLYFLKFPDCCRYIHKVWRTEQFFFFILELCIHAISDNQGNKCNQHFPFQRITGIHPHTSVA